MIYQNKGLYTCDHHGITDERFGWEQADHATEEEDFYYVNDAGVKVKAAGFVGSWVCTGRWEPLGFSPSMTG